MSNSQRPASAKRIWIPLGILVTLVAVIITQGKFSNLTAQLTQEEDQGKEEDTVQYPILGACGRDEQTELFRWVPPEELSEGEKDVIDIWSEEYNAQVSAIVEEYQSADQSKIDCLSDSLESLLPAGEQMLDLASKLPPWKDPDDSAQLSYLDTQTVLLEYLRTYECALVGRYFNLFGDVMKEMKGIYEQQDSVLWWGNVFREFGKQERKIRHELAVSRTSLNRLLLLLNGYGRMRPLEMEVECFRRATIDFRNSLAAAAEASACLPRAWDAKDPMRDSQ
jgi:hypothetical protein